MLGKLPQTAAVWIDRLFVTPGWVVLLFVLESIKYDSVDAHGLNFWNAPLPDVAEGCIEPSIVLSFVDFFAECNVLSIREDERKFFIGCNKDVVDAVVCSVDDLDVFHKWRNE
jgi:hypothetical protein